MQCSGERLVCRNILQEFLGQPCYGIKYQKDWIQPLQKLPLTWKLQVLVKHSDPTNIWEKPRGGVAAYKLLFFFNSEKYCCLFLSLAAVNQIFFPRLFHDWSSRFYNFQIDSPILTCTRTGRLAGLWCIQHGLAGGHLVVNPSHFYGARQNHWCKSEWHISGLTRLGTESSLSPGFCLHPLPLPNSIFLLPSSTFSHSTVPAEVGWLFPYSPAASAGWCDCLHWPSSIPD